MSKDYKLRKIRVLLIEGFTEGELRDFCFDEAEFRLVHDQLSPGIGKDEIIRRLIEHAERRTLFEILLTWAKEQNPTKFEEHRPYHNLPSDTARSTLPASFSIPDPLMNCETELAAFEKIATGQDTQTRLISVHGPSGTGKSRLLHEYERVAGEHGLDLLTISLAQQLSIEDCLYQIASRFGLQHFSHYDEFLTADRPELTRLKEIEWQGQLTRTFFRDLGQYTAAPRLVLFFDQYEKADHAFKEWFTRIFLPGLFAQYSLMVVVAGQEQVQLKAAGPGQRHFHLNGLSVDWFHRYVAECNVQLDPNLINEFHKLLGGYPKRFVDYVRARIGGVS